MATLIRSARISRERRLLGGGEHPPGGARPAGEDDAVVPDRPAAGVGAVSGSAPERMRDDKVSAVEQELAQMKAHAAETEAELQRLLRDLDELRQEARQQGYDAGHKEGFEAARQELATQLDELDNLSRRIAECYEADIASLEAGAVEVVFAATSKIVGETLLTVEGVAAVVNQALKQVAKRDKLVVHVSSADKQRLDEARRLSGHSMLDGALEVVADDRVVLGGCILETRGGNLDARIEVQLQKLGDCLRQAASRRIHEGGERG
ncbi:MAG TPA: hypothetical protein ENJ79_06050 [Gammaproteobacteria bacterium]|nr:hypothetical protein [Gammaproteobacteria bacterium]